MSCNARNNVCTVADIVLCESSEFCCICLESISFSDRSSLDQCEHIYHKSCILSWSGIENACPLCKKRFNVIHDTATNKKINIDFKVQPANNYIDFDMIWVDCVCDHCGCGDNEQLLLFCNGCNCISHTYCVGLGDATPSEYYCDDCCSKKVIQRLQQQKLLKKWQKEVGIIDNCDKLKIKTYARKNRRKYQPKRLKLNSSKLKSLQNYKNDDITSNAMGKAKHNTSSLNRLPTPLLSNILIICGVGNKKRVLRFRGNVNGKHCGSSLANLFTYSEKCKSENLKSKIIDYHSASKRKRNRKRKYNQIDSDSKCIVKKIRYNHSAPRSALTYL